VVAFFGGGEMETSNGVILSMSGIHISFPGVHALDEVDFTLRRGEIHSIMGQNGAGKSTLIKILTGVYRKELGTITLNGAPFEPTSPLEARRYGVNSVYQEINLCDNLSVAENIYTGRQKTTLGKIDWKYVNFGAVRALERLNVAIDVTKPLADFTVAIKQMVAIARAVDMDSKILILDEPTSSLDRAEVEQLFTVVCKLRDEGMSVIFITHFLDQVYELCDRVTILRNGKLIGEYLLKDLPKVELVAKMVGMEFSTLEKKDNTRKNTKENEILMEVKNIGKRRTVQPFDLTLRKGEALGFAGLLGSGRTESANLLFGIDEIDTGEIKLKNKKIKLKKPRDAISNYIAFCPEDRKKNGIITDLSVRENIILAMQAKQGIFKYIPMKKQLELAEELMSVLSIGNRYMMDVPAGNLSGGNQQKTILARWLVTNPELLILDEPTRGIDVHAKAEIMNLAMNLCDKGMSLVFISSELGEVVRCSDRIAVMRDRKKITEMSGADLDEQMILKAIAAEEKTAEAVR
jgi:simple sugar transport system ATP-binding protein